MRVNNMDLSFPHQCFIDNEFVDSSDGRTFETINPSDESVSVKTDLDHQLYCIIFTLNPLSILIIKINNHFHVNAL